MIQIIKGKRVKHFQTLFVFALSLHEMKDTPKFVLSNRLGCKLKLTNQVKNFLLIIPGAHVAPIDACLTSRELRNDSALPRSSDRIPRLRPKDSSLDVS
jgi:hypothetical protein